MHESDQAGNSDPNIRDLLSARLDNLQREISGKSIGEVAAHNEVIADTGVETENEAEIQAVAEDHPHEIEAEIQRLNDEEAELKAKRQRIMDNAAAEAERLRNIAAKLERQRETELAAEAEKRQREIDAELERQRQAEAEAEQRRLAEAAKAEAEYQRQLEDEIERQRLIKAEAARQVAIEAAKAERQRIAEEELAVRMQETVSPDTLEYKVPIKQLDTLSSDTAQHDTVTNSRQQKAKRKVMPRVLVLASCASAILTGVAAATGHDAGLVDKAKTYLEASPSKNKTANVETFRVKLPKAILETPKASAPEVTLKEPKNKSKKTNPEKPVIQSERQPPATPAAPERRPSPQPESRQVPVPAPEKKDSGSTKRAEPPKGLTREQANPDNYNSAHAGGASYGNVPTEAGGAKPYVPSR